MNAFKFTSSSSSKPPPLPPKDPIYMQRGNANRSFGSLLSPEPSPSPTTLNNTNGHSRHGQGYFGGSGTGNSSPGPSPLLDSSKNKSSTSVASSPKIRSNTAPAATSTMVSAGGKLASGLFGKFGRKSGPRSPGGAQSQTQTMTGSEEMEDMPPPPQEDGNISLPWGFSHNIHVDEGLVGLPPSWSTSLRQLGFSEEEIQAIQSRRMNLPANFRPPAGTTGGTAAANGTPVRPDIRYLYSDRSASSQEGSSQGASSGGAPVLVHPAPRSTSLPEHQHGQQHRPYQQSVSSTLRSISSESQGQSQSQPQRDAYNHPDPYRTPLEEKPTFWGVKRTNDTQAASSSSSGPPHLNLPSPSTPGSDQGKGQHSPDPLDLVSHFSISPPPAQSTSSSWSTSIASAAQKVKAKVKKGKRSVGGSSVEESYANVATSGNGGYAPAQRSLGQVVDGGTLDISHAQQDQASTSNPTVWEIYTRPRADSGAGSTQPPKQAQPIGKSPSQGQLRAQYAGAGWNSPARPQPSVATNGNSPSSRAASPSLQRSRANSKSSLRSAGSSRGIPRRGPAPPHGSGSASASATSLDSIPEADVPQLGTVHDRTAGTGANGSRTNLSSSTKTRPSMDTTEESLASLESHSLRNEAYEPLGPATKTRKAQALPPRLSLHQSKNSGDLKAWSDSLLSGGLGLSMDLGLDLEREFDMRFGSSDGGADTAKPFGGIESKIETPATAVAPPLKAKVSQPQQEKQKPQPRPQLQPQPRTKELVQIQAQELVETQPQAKTLPKANPLPPAPAVPKIAPAPTPKRTASPAGARIQRAASPAAGLGKSGLSSVNTPTLVPEQGTAPAPTAPWSTLPSALTPAPDSGASVSPSSYSPSSSTTSPSSKTLMPRHSQSSLPLARQILPSVPAWVNNAPPLPIPPALGGVPGRTPGFVATVAGRTPSTSAGTGAGVVTGRAKSLTRTGSLSRSGSGSGSRSAGASLSRSGSKGSRERGDLSALLKNPLPAPVAPLPPPPSSSAPIGAIDDSPLTKGSKPLPPILPPPPRPAPAPPLGPYPGSTIPSSLPTVPSTIAAVPPTAPSARSASATAPNGSPIPPPIVLPLRNKPANVVAVGSDGLLSPPPPVSAGWRRAQGQGIGHRKKPSTSESAAPARQAPSTEEGSEKALDDESPNATIAFSPPSSGGPDSAQLWSQIEAMMDPVVLSAIPGLSPAVFTQGSAGVGQSGRVEARAEGDESDGSDYGDENSLIEDDRGMVAQRQKRALSLDRADQRGNSSYWNEEDDDEYSIDDYYNQRDSTLSADSTQSRGREMNRGSARSSMSTAAAIPTTIVRSSSISIARRTGAAYRVVHSRSPSQEPMPGSRNGETGTHTHSEPPPPFVAHVDPAVHLRQAQAGGLQPYGHPLPSPRAHGAYGSIIQTPTSAGFSAESETGTASPSVLAYYQDGSPIPTGHSMFGARGVVAGSGGVLPPRLEGEVYPDYGDDLEDLEEEVKKKGIPSRKGHHPTIVINDHPASLSTDTTPIPTPNPGGEGAQGSETPGTAFSTTSTSLQTPSPLSPYQRYEGWVTKVVEPLSEFIDECVDPRNHYLDLQEIGESASGSVYKAMVNQHPDPSLIGTLTKLPVCVREADEKEKAMGIMTLVAIKSVAILPGGSEKLEDVRKELTLLKELSSAMVRQENILWWDAVYVDLQDDALWIRMELMERSLADVVGLVGGGLILHDRMIARFASDIANALDFLHRNRIAHRDVRSDNMLLNKHGILKLTDFSCAVQLPPTVNTVTDPAGVLYWQAPEIIRGIPYNPFKADIWSLGATVWELAESEPPFSQTNIASDRWPALSQPQMYPPAMHDFLRKCSEPEPGRVGSGALIKNPFINNACGRAVIVQLLSQCLAIEETLREEEEEQA